MGLACHHPCKTVPFLMMLVQLFLGLFRICVFCLTLKKSAFAKIALLWLENNYYRRYFRQHNIKAVFKPHEKQTIHTFFALTKTQLVSFVWSLRQPFFHAGNMLLPKAGRLKNASLADRRFPKNINC